MSLVLLLVSNAPHVVGDARWLVGEDVHPVFGHGDACDSRRCDSRHDIAGEGEEFHVRRVTTGVARGAPRRGGPRFARFGAALAVASVSYTHLTLPTIYSV